MTYAQINLEICKLTEIQKPGASSMMPYVERNGIRGRDLY